MKKKVVLSVAVVLLVVMVAVMCAACTPNSDKLKTKLEDKGYTVTVNNSVSGNSDATKQLMATNLKEKEGVTVTWFKDSKTAKKYYEDANDNKGTFKLLYGDDVKIVKKGNAVVVGTENAVKLV